MPHQCLKCGHVFEEGSSQLLKGCPGCGGNRFFFTKQPLSAEERAVITKEASQDITTKIMQLAMEKNKDAMNGTETWITIKPKDLRTIIKDRIKQEEPVKEPSSVELISDTQRMSIIEKIKAEVDHSDTPETIGVEQPGRYHIDLKGLLEKEPIVIQKDGSYTIHLPSAFKMLDEKKQKRR
jgi:predicted  nucleic acid-binding Zn-ribbon protein